MIPSSKNMNLFFFSTQVNLVLWDTRRRKKKCADEGGGWWVGGLSNCQIQETVRIFPSVCNVLLSLEKNAPPKPMLNPLSDIIRRPPSSTPPTKSTDFSKNPCQRRKEGREDNSAFQTNCLPSFLPTPFFFFFC